ncbi:hypothetical protein FJQ54_03480 [Sandaracinobacter neustonicus]|uniref:Uncharacterized protein n=1 Tax=Sandaracinobacter neustonicus TaxID=1715348 RepID=A0A501XTM0_9SPHN|nr:hypothetical protein [Sandaracinobacter neustonicus]TPE63916.1 hypothetical protein FJQ54_03480 [Sandaracinobacter neustonicus]
MAAPVSIAAAVLATFLAQPLSAGGIASCRPLDTRLTPQRTSEYAQLVADALVAKVRPQEVKVRRFMRSGAWSAVNVSTPVSDDGVMFFRLDGKHQQYKGVWGGWATPDDRAQLIAWAHGIGAPTALAHCFADSAISR